MKIAGATVLLTGASRGIGAILAEDLALRGANLVLVARSQSDLDATRARVAQHGGRVIALSANLSERSAVDHVVNRAEQTLGPIDVLINNAALDISGYYEDLTCDEIETVVALNLTAPMLLTRLLLPGMLERDRGHVLNIASMAGLGPFAFGETYGSTKHGLVGFTRALRASLKTRGSRVSASVLCPGFVFDTGLFRDALDHYTFAPPRFTGGCTSRQVVRAALRAIARDEPEVVVNSMPLRAPAAFALALTRAAERLARAVGLYDAAQLLAEHRRRERNEGEKPAPRKAPETTA